LLLELLLTRVFDVLYLPNLAYIIIRKEKGIAPSNLGKGEEM
jgi:hypothetical protein